VLQPPDHLKSPSKAQLRKQMRQQRQALAPPAQLSAASAASHRISQLPGWSEATRIALYIANDGEMDASSLEALCREDGKQLFLPVIEENSELVFGAWPSDITLVANRFGIPEPGADVERCSASAMDVVVLPLVAWDLRGGRLGMGGGFYDRTFAGVNGPLLVGLAHSLQQVSFVPQDPWDISMNFVVTDTALHCCKVETN
jgi:5-formyltetrahydrofolate cyclo-ligase